MYKCYLGTLNPVKLQAVRTVLKDYEVIGVSVDSGVSSQPMSDSETIKGALNRAQGLPKETFRIGLEGGLERLGNTYYLVNFGVLIDEDDNVFYAGGTRLPLPKVITDRVINEKLELSLVMDEFLGTSGTGLKEGAIGYFTNNEVKRVDIFIHIVKLLYGQYLYFKENKGGI